MSTLPSVRGLSPIIGSSFVYPLGCTMTSVVLAAGVPAQVVPSNFGRRLMMIQNVGLSPLSFSFATLAPGGGISLDPPLTPNGQGGSIEFKDAIPGEAIWAVSAGGTTIVVMEGF